MKKNISSLDKGIRITLAIIFAALYFTGTLQGTIGIVLLVLGGIFMLTSLLGTCPIYSVLGISTCPIPEQE